MTDDPVLAAIARANPEPYPRSDPTDQQLLARILDTPTTQPRRRRPPAYILAPGLSIAIVIVVVIVFGVANRSAPLDSSVTPGISHADQQTEQQAIQQANRAAQGTPACTTKQTAAPLIGHGAPSRAFVSILGVLRTGFDRRPILPVEMLQDAREFEDGHERLAVAEHGSYYYVLPFGSFAQSSSVQPITARCQAAMVSALHRGLDKLPARLRAGALQLQAGQFRALAKRFGPGVCLGVETPAAFNVVCSNDAGQLRRRGMITQFKQLSGVVPDGVASVTVHYPQTASRSALTTTVPVTHNVFVTNITIDSRGRTQPSLIWRAPNGSTISTVPGVRRVATHASFVSRHDHKP